MSDRTTQAPDPADYQRARSEHAVIQAQIAVQLLRIERRQLVRKDALENAVAAFYGRIRDTLLTMPDRHAAIIAADYMIDSQRLNLALVAMFRKMLEDFADG
jgi:hypothetical protein